MTINDRYFRNLVLGFGYNYHVTNWLSFGANVGYAVPIKTGLAENIESEKSEMGNSYSVPATHLGLVSDLHVSAIPLYGKVLLLNSVSLGYDFHFMAGAGLMQVMWNTEAIDNIQASDSFVFTPVFGGGLRVFVTHGVALNFDVIDRFGAMNVAAKGDGTVPAEEWTHNIMFQLGVSIFLPLKILTEE